MAKASPAQVNFNAGKLSRRMEGRIDLAKYQNGCRELTNFIPQVQGPAVKRSGTRFVKEVKDSADAARLISFEFSTDQAYILLFGDLYMWVFMDGGIVLESTKTITGITQANPGVVTAVAHGYENGDTVYIDSVVGMTEVNGFYFTVANKAADTFEIVDTSGYTAYTSGGTAARVVEITTPYAKADLDGIQYAQSADVLYLAHKGYAPQKIERTSHTAWTITPIAFDWQPFQPENEDDGDYIFATAVTGTSITLTSSSGKFTSDMVGSYVKFREVVASHNMKWAANSNLALCDTFEGAGFGLGDQAYYEANVYKLINQNGKAVTGTNPPIHTESTQGDGQYSWEFLHPGSGYAKITAFTDAYKVTADVVERIPRACADALKTIVTLSDATPIVVNIVGHGMDTGDKIFVHGTNLSTINNTVYTVTLVDVNNVSLDGTTASGAGTGGTAAQVYWGPWDGAVRLGKSSWRWSLGAFGAEAGYPRTVSFFEDRLWWAGTTGNPQTLWASKTGDYENHQTGDGDDFAMLHTINTDQVNVIEWISPGKVLSIGTAGGEFVAKAAVQSEGLTPGNLRVEAHSSYGSRANVLPVRVESVVLFVQRAGRKLREFVYNFDEDSYLAPDLTVLADDVTINQIKQIAFQQEPNRNLWCILDDGSLVAMTYERAQDVLGWHEHTVGGTGVLVESIATIPHPDGDSDQLWMIVSRTIDGGTKRYVEYMEKEWLRTNDIEDAFFVDSGLTYDSTPTVTITGLDHLEGETVKVLGDGVQLADATVSGGSITIVSSSVVQVGLSYDALLQSMRFESGGADGVAQGKTKRFTRCVIRLDQVGAGLLYGHEDDEANMDAVQLTAGALTDGDTDSLAWPKGYEQAGRIALKHTQPLPCAITAILPQVVVQDR